MTPEIRTLADDEVISEPGFYNITLDRHHNQPCDGPSVTSGVLRKMELATPADVWAFHALNPERIEQEDKKVLWMGRAMAAFIEGGAEEVLKHFSVLPPSKPRKPTAQQIEAYEQGRATDKGIESVEFWRKVEADTRTPLTDADMQMICDMGTALANDPMACAVMSGIPEVTMAVQDPLTGLWLLARPDTVSFDGAMSDYKKMNTQGAPFTYRLVDQRITKHGYDMQMAFAAETMESLTGMWPSSVGIVAQTDKAPHHVILREIADDDLRLAQFRNRRAINAFAECLSTGHWPGPGEDVGAYQRPEWLREKILEEMQAGEVA